MNRPKSLLATDYELWTAQSVNRLKDLATAQPRTYNEALARATHALVSETRRQALPNPTIELPKSLRQLGKVQPLITKAALREFAAGDRYTWAKIVGHTFNTLAHHAYDTGIQIAMPNALERYRALSDLDYAAAERRLVYVAPPGIAPIRGAFDKRARMRYANMGIDTISFIKFMAPNKASRAEWVLGRSSLNLATDYYKDLLQYASELEEYEATT